MIESTMKIIKHATKIAQLEKSRDHRPYVENALWAHRNTPHSLTQKTPFELFFGRKNNFTMLKPQEHEDIAEDKIAAAERRKRDEVLAKQASIINKYNASRKQHSFKLNEKVLVAPNADNVYDPELYRIIAIDGNKITSLRMSDNRLMIRHASCYKHYKTLDDDDNATPLVTDVDAPVDNDRLGRQSPPLDDAQQVDEFHTPPTTPPRATNTGRRYMPSAPPMPTIPDFTPSAPPISMFPDHEEMPRAPVMPEARPETLRAQPMPTEEPNQFEPGPPSPPREAGPTRRTRHSGLEAIPVPNVMPASLDRPTHYQREMTRRFQD